MNRSGKGIPLDSWLPPSLHLVKPRNSFSLDRHKGVGFLPYSIIEMRSENLRDEGLTFLKSPATSSKKYHHEAPDSKPSVWNLGAFTGISRGQHSGQPLGSRSGLCGWSSTDHQGEQCCPGITVTTCVTDGSFQPPSIELRQVKARHRACSALHTHPKLGHGLEGAMDCGADPISPSVHSNNPDASRGLSTLNMKTAWGALPTPFALGLSDHSSKPPH